MSEAWNRFVNSNPAAHFLQLREWGYFKEKFGWTSSCVVDTFDMSRRDSRSADSLSTDSQYASTSNSNPNSIAADQALGGPISSIQIESVRICSGAQILYRPLLDGFPFSSRLGLKLAYIPKGPLVEWHNEAAVLRLLAKIDAECRQKGVGTLKIEPDLPDTTANRALLVRYGFRPSQQTVQPRSTVVLDISGSEEQILGQMKSKWRYNIRLAKRKEVTVRPVMATDLPAFNKLMQTTGERNAFHVHDASYYNTAFNLFVPQNASFMIAEYQGQPLAAVAIMVAGKRAWYPWGASSNVERNRMPNYALHWAAILWAKSRGATTYDFWGIPDPIGKLAMSMPQATEEGVPSLDVPVDLQNLPTGELWGVYRLKQGFGGNVFRTVGAWDRTIQPVADSIYRLGLAARSWRSVHGPTSPEVPLLR